MIGDEGRSRDIGDVSEVKFNNFLNACEISEIPGNDCSADLTGQESNTDVVVEFGIRCYQAFLKNEAPGKPDLS